MSDADVADGKAALALVDQDDAVGLRAGAAEEPA